MCPVIYSVSVKLMAGIEEQLRLAWHGLSRDFPAYALVMPGDPSFICQAEACDAHCCRAFSVPLGEGEVERMTKFSGFSPGRFLESEAGEPLALPMVQPYLLARNEGSCILLREDRGCGQYAGRPDACRMYPHQLVVVENGRAAFAAGNAVVRRGLESMAADTGPAPVTVLLLRHRECPGFTGSPLTIAEWFRTLYETCDLQFPIGN